MRAWSGPSAALRPRIAIRHGSCFARSAGSGHVPPGVIHGRRRCNTASHRRDKGCDGMKSKATVHLVLAMLLAIVAGALTLNWLAKQKGRAPQGETTQGAPAPAKATVEVVVAKKALERGMRLVPDMLGTVPYDPDAVPPQSFTRPDELADRVLSRKLSPGDPVTADKLFPKGVTAAGLEQIVEPGKRAVTVKGGKELGAGGLITPGCRVDVIMTMDSEEKLDPDEPDIKESKLFLSDIPILAAGTEMETKIGKDGREELSPTDYFTLLVTPEEAEKLAYAVTNHVLTFALRSPGDQAREGTPGADLSALVERSESAVPAAAAEEPPVEVIRGLSKRHRPPKEDTFEKKAAPGSRSLLDVLTSGSSPAAGGDMDETGDADRKDLPLVIAK
ncbi:Flp pilus assembly protein CpaB [Desulfolutivibrio sulfoxidireducens]|nr:Flp pilus assembly protein CpaB [Desulfolutivibrio sulfoxidireducens]